jgi:hypothetical protein
VRHDEAVRRTGIAHTRCVLPCCARVNRDAHPSAASRRGADATATRQVHAAARPVGRDVQRAAGGHESAVRAHRPGLLRQRGCGQAGPPVSRERCGDRCRRARADARGRPGGQYKLELRMRNHSTHDRPTILRELATCVPPEHVVDLEDPEVFILVEVFKVMDARRGVAKKHPLGATLTSAAERVRHWCRARLLRSRQVQRGRARAE